MTVPTPDAPEPFITDERAVSWFMRRRGGGALYDEHMSLIRSAFGDDVSVSFKAAVDPSSGEPTVLIIEIHRPLEDEDSWSRLVQVQQGLLARQEDLARYLKLKAPFRNVVVSLSDERSDWDEFVANLESGQ